MRVLTINQFYFCAELIGTNVSEYKGKEVGKQFSLEKQTNYGSTVKRLLYYYNIKNNCGFSSETLHFFYFFFFSSFPGKMLTCLNQNQISSKVLMTFC